MTKFSSFAAYPPRSLAGAEAALLTAWASLERFHDDLVLLGGLAVKYLTKQGAGLLPGPVTMDVDLGVTLVAEAGGQYGSMADDLAGQGFKRDDKGISGLCLSRRPSFPRNEERNRLFHTVAAGRKRIEGTRW